MKQSGLVLIALGFVMTSALARADQLMPSFAGAPIGWTVDRYAPTSFGDVGTFQGRNNVLGIRITSAGNLANRGSNFQTSFYNTQGMAYAVTGGVGSFISADLFIPQEWSDPANGNVRTDMWGVLPNTKVSIDPRDYPIIGFTNYGVSPRLRIWDGNVGWVNLAVAPNYGAWNSFSITYTGSAYDFAVNGSSVGSSTPSVGVTGFSAVLMQGFNFADSSATGAPNAILENYTAHWSNTVSVPEPGFYSSLLSLGMGMGGLVYFARRRRKTSL